MTASILGGHAEKSLPLARARAKASPRDDLMLNTFRLVLAALMLGGPLAPAPSLAADAPACPATLDHVFPRLQDEKPQTLCQYSGKVVLVVNTASYCHFTPQYEGLESLYKKYQDRGLVVLGFPSNDFAQESGGNRQIAEFCANTYGVKFPMFAKSSVRGDAANRCTSSSHGRPGASRCGISTST